MNEFTKSAILMFLTALLGAAISSFSTVSNLGSDIAVLSNKVGNITKAVDIIVTNQDKFDDRLRQNEIRQAQYKQSYLAAN